MLKSAPVHEVRGVSSSKAFQSPTISFIFPLLSLLGFFLHAASPLSPMEAAAMEINL